MKAATHTQYGSSHVLQVEEVETPTAGPNEVLIQVHASPVTEGDRRLRAADFPGLSAIVGRLMFGLFKPRNTIPGTNLAGRVVAVGEGVTRFSVGDDVFGSCDNSAQAEFVALDQDGPIARIPAGISYEDACAVPYGAATALAFLRDVARVKTGERVLVVGASGGVGRFAVQIAKHLGAHVTGVSSGRNVEMVRTLGADAVIDYQRADYTKSGELYDVIFDTTTGDGFRGAKHMLNQGGRYVTLYLNPRVMWQMLTTSIFGGRKVASAVVLGNQDLTNDVAELLAHGAIHPVVASHYPLAQVAQAHAEQEAGRPGGTVVVRVRSKPLQTRLGLVA